MKPAIECDDDKFYCSSHDLQEFKESRVWKEITSWIVARATATRSGINSSDLLSGDKDKQNNAAAALMKAEALEDLLELPDLIIATMQVRAKNEEIDESKESIGDSIEEQTNA